MRRSSVAIRRRNTRQRTLVLEAVRNRRDHPTAEDIYLDVRAHDDRVSRATVYRNLRFLEGEHAITCVKAPGGDRFDLRLDDHAHVVCTECGAVVDATVPYDRDADDAVATGTGYAIATHRTIFEGICPACQQKFANTAS